MSIPRHMERSVHEWVQHGQPHPLAMRSFFRAILLHDFMTAIVCADDENKRALFDWAMHLHNEVPSLCHGSMERLVAWHVRGGLEVRAEAS